MANTTVWTSTDRLTNTWIPVGRVVSLCWFADLLTYYYENCRHFRTHSQSDPSKVIFRLGNQFIGGWCYRALCVGVSLKQDLLYILTLQSWDHFIWDISLSFYYRPINASLLTPVCNHLSPRFFLFIVVDFMQYNLSLAGLNQSTVSYIPRQAGVQRTSWCL